jgi:hypothetical protein
LPPGSPFCHKLQQALFGFLSGQDKQCFRLPPPCRSSAGRSRRRTARGIDARRRDAHRLAVLAGDRRSRFRAGQDCDSGRRFSGPSPGARRFQRVVVLRVGWPRVRSAQLAPSNSVMRSRATYFRGRADRIAWRSWRRAKSRVDRQIGAALQPAGSVSVIRDVGKLFPDRGSVCVIPIWVSAQDAQIDRNQDRTEAVAGRNLV